MMQTKEELGQSWLKAGGMVAFKSEVDVKCWQRRKSLSGFLDSNFLQFGAGLTGFNPFFSKNHDEQQKDGKPRKTKDDQQSFQCPEQQPDK